MRIFLRIIVTGILLWIALLFFVLLGVYIGTGSLTGDVLAAPVGGPVGILIGAFLILLGIPAVTILATVTLFLRIEKNFLSMGVVTSLLWVAISISLDLLFVMLFRKKLPEESKQYYVFILIYYVTMFAYPIGMGVVLRAKVLSGAISSARSAGKPAAPAASLPRLPAPISSVMTPTSPLLPPKAGG